MGKIKFDYSGGNASACRAIARREWGAVQQQKTIIKGVTEYSTARHGGYVVDGYTFNIDRIPEKFLYAPGFKFGVFEEDAAWAVLFYYYPEIAQAYYKKAAKTHGAGFYEKYTTYEAFYKNCVTKTVVLYYPEFLPTV